MSTLAPFRKILVPTDLSETSLAALRRALDLARRAEGSVTLLHVYHPPPYELSEDTAEKIAGAARRGEDR
jgi:nucleotide-binding universal stress UspA family protein